MECPKCHYWAALELLPDGKMQHYYCRGCDSWFPSTLRKPTKKELATTAAKLRKAEQRDLEKFLKSLFG